MPLYFRWSIFVPTLRSAVIRMGSMWWLILIALGMGLAGLAAVLWPLRNGQYDDLDGAAERVLLEEDPDDKGQPPQDR